MDVCKQFHADPTRNPRTGRKIEYGKGTYLALVAECGPPPNPPNKPVESMVQSFSEMTIERPKPFKPIEPIKPFEPIKPIEPIKPFEPIKPINNNEPIKPINRNEVPDVYKVAHPMPEKFPEAPKAEPTIPESWKIAHKIPTSFPQVPTDIIMPAVPKHEFVPIEPVKPFDKEIRELIKANPSLKYEEAKVFIEKYVSFIKQNKVDFNTSKSLFKLIIGNKNLLYDDIYLRKLYSLR